jgi:hypothetical protein
VNDIIADYNSVVKVVDKNARASDREYGGVVRAVKGKLVESIADDIIHIAWNRLGQDKQRLQINRKKINILLKPEYLDSIKNKTISDYIRANLDSYKYKVSVDKHILIDGKFKIGIECKAFSENAMIKRILIDFHLLKTKFPKLKCILLQLESQLGGDYSALPEVTLGSKPTHTLMSYFPNVDLNIITLLKGERKIDRPIHKNFKELTVESLENAIQIVMSHLKDFV